jgi:Outer membrane lipoprotein-sorting protein
MTRSILMFAAAFAFCTPGHILAQDVVAKSDARLMLERADEYRNFRGKTFSFDLTLVSKEGGEEDKAFKLRAEILNTHTSLVTYSDPVSERGKALLMDGTNLWFSTPSNSKPIRITPQQRLLGEASNGDVASTDFSGDYDAVTVGQENVDGVAATKLELTAKPNSLAAYSKLHLYVKTSDAQPLKADFFAPSGKLLKSAIYTKYETLANQAGKRQLTELEIVSAVNQSKKTVMRFDNFKVEPIPQSRFTTAFLGRIR